MPRTDGPPPDGSLTPEERGQLLRTLLAAADALGLDVSIRARQIEIGCNRIHITSESGGAIGTRIEIDGNDISTLVTAITMHCRAGDLWRTSVELDLLGGARATT